MCDNLNRKRMSLAKHETFCIILRGTYLDKVLPSRKTIFDVVNSLTTQIV